MLDIKLIRENPEFVRENLERRGKPEKIQQLDELIELDLKWRRKLTNLNEMRRERNKISMEISEMKKKGIEVPRELLEKSKNLSEEIEKEERELRKLEERIKFLLMSLPNLIHESVPYGESEEDNVPIRYWGKPRVYEEELEQFLAMTNGEVEPEVIEFKPKVHTDLLLELDVADIERAGKASGSRFYYLKNELVLLDMALMRFALDKLIEKGFTPVIPPYMLRRKAEEGVTDFSAFEEVLYKVEEEDLYLIPTSEHPLAAMHMEEVLEERELPLRYAGVSPCFRKEAGTAGKATKGIFRVHQFHKVEQFSFTLPEQSWEEHEFFLKNAEEMYRELEIPYVVVNICSGDIGVAAAKQYDILAWMPGHGKYREVVSCSNCTDWQARRLRIRYRARDGKLKFVHTLNSTAIATTRTIVAILENFQREDGSVEIPKALRKYCGFKKIRPSEKEIYS